MDTFGAEQPSVQNRRWLLPAIVGLIVVIVAGSFAFWWYRVRERVSAVEGGNITSAPSGKMVSEMPESLLVEPEADIEESYRLEYENGIKQPVLRYRSAMSLADNFKSYKEKIVAERWAIAQEDAQAPVGFIYAVKDNMELNATFAEDAEGVVVTVAYAIHPENL